VVYKYDVYKHIMAYDLGQYCLLCHEQIDFITKTSKGRAYSEYQF